MENSSLIRTVVLHLFPPLVFDRVNLGDTFSSRGRLAPLFTGSTALPTASIAAVAAADALALANGDSW